MIKKFRSYFSKNLHTKDFLIVLLGTGVSQLLPLLFAPVLTRYYSANNFGDLAILLAFSNPISVIISAKYEIAIVLCVDELDAGSLVLLSALIAFVISCVLALLLYFAKDYLIITKSIDPMILITLPLLCFCIGVTATINYWLQWKREFAKIALNKISQTWTISILSLFLAFFMKDSGLVLSYLTGWIFVTIYSVRQLLVTGFRVSEVSYKSIINVLIKFKEFPLYNSVPALLNTISMSIPVLIISSNYSHSLVGYFTFCRQILYTPSSFISASIKQVFYERIASKTNVSESIRSYYKKFLYILIMISILIALPFLLTGPQLFVFLFGENWVTAGQISQILIISIAIQFVVIPMSISLTGLKRIKRASFWQLLYAISLSILYYINTKDFFSFMIILTAIEAIYYLLFMIWINKSINEYELSVSNQMS